MCPGLQQISLKSDKLYLATSIVKIVESIAGLAYLEGIFNQNNWPKVRRAYAEHIYTRTHTLYMHMCP